MKCAQLIMTGSLWYVLIAVWSLFQYSDAAGCDKLRRELEKACCRYPTSTELRKIFIRSCGNDYDEMDRDFPFTMMEDITSMKINFNSPNQMGLPASSWLKYRGFEPSKLETIRTKLTPILKNHNFTLRHYAIKRHKSIKSNFALWEEGKIKSSGTSGIDWQYLGDTAFTFWWFCIDGIPPINNQDFIKDSEVYDEIQLDEAGLRRRGLWNVDFFASEDLMKRAAVLPDVDIQEVPILLRGKLQDIAEIIFGYFWLSKKTAYVQLEEIGNNAEETIAQMLLRMIDLEFPGFEVKIPGTVTNTDWKKIDKKKGFFNWLYG